MTAGRLGLVMGFGLLALPAGAATICVNPGGTGGCQAGIQNGVSAAAPGDTVRILAGTYNENVVVATSNLQIVGANKLTTILDADAPNSSFGILVLATGVQIKNLTIRNGQGTASSIGVGSGSTGTIIQGVRIVGNRAVTSIPNPYGGAAIASGPVAGLQIIGNEIRSCRFGVYFLDGVSSSVIKGNTIVGASSTGIVIGPTSANNANNQVVFNKICNTPMAISVSGDTAIVSGNTIENATSVGASVSGLNPVVASNKLTAAGALVGFCTTCTGGSIKGNTIVGSRTAGFGLFADSDAAGLVVQTNKVNLTFGFGLQVGGNTVQVAQNTVTDTAGASGVFGSCFYGTGPAHTFTKDTALRCGGAGFYLNGDTNSVVQSTATSVATTGFVIDGSGGVINNTLTGNRAISSVGQGFAVLGGATGQTLTGNSAQKNRLDYCGPVVAPGQFATQSTTCDILQ